MKQTCQWITITSALLGAVALLGCSSTSKSTLSPPSRAEFGKMPDGTPVDIYTLRNSKGSEARIMTYGGIVVSLKVPDRDGKMGDVVWGFDNLQGYLSKPPPPYFGALIGRYGNRIAKAKFTLDGKTYNLPANDGQNSLHGGTNGFDKVVWTAVSSVGSKGPSLQLSYLSKDGDQGYPGNLKVTATYTLTEDNALELQFTATTDKDTVVNLTHHSYFNLAGSGDILNHTVMMPADTFTPVDSTLIPTGELRPVKGTPFDFNTATAIGARINQNDEQLGFGKGYDHNWVIKKPLGKLGLMAKVYEPTTGRVMEVLSDEPGLQFYSGNFLDGTLTGKGGQVYKLRSAFCMEPQHYPDSPNHPQFPSTVLKPGQTFHNTIIYKFSVQK